MTAYSSYSFLSCFVFVLHMRVFTGGSVCLKEWEKAKSWSSLAYRVNIEVIQSEM